MHSCAVTHIWNSEDKWQALALPFHHVSPIQLTQVIRSDSRSLYLLHHLATQLKKKTIKSMFIMINATQRLLKA